MLGLRRNTRIEVNNVHLRLNDIPELDIHNRSNLSA